MSRRGNRGTAATSHGRPIEEPQSPPLSSHWTIRLFLVLYLLSSPVTEQKFYEYAIDKNPSLLSEGKMGAYKYVSELYRKKQSDVMRYLLRVR